VGVLYQSRVIMSKKLFSGLFVVFLFASVACLTADESNATATSESGGVDTAFLISEATARAKRASLTKSS
jgi:hypothetical protein